MEIEKSYNGFYYKYSEKGIKNRNLKLWENINNSIINDNLTFKEKFYLYEKSILEIPKCYCGNDVKFIDMVSGFREFCSKKCMMNSVDIKNKRIKTNNEKYGVDNPSKSDEVKNKVKSTNLKKFGVEYPLQSKEIVNKSKEIFMEKYGVDNPSKVKEIREKAENTMLEKLGVKHAMLSDEIKNELKDYFLEKYGVDNPSKVKDIREKAENTMIEKYGVKHALQSKQINDSLKEFFIEKYGVDNPLKVEEVRKKGIETLLEKYGVDNPFKYDEFRKKGKETSIEKYGVESFSQSQNYKELLKTLSFNKNSILVNNENYKLLESNISEYVIKHESCGHKFTIQIQLFRKRLKNNEEVCIICNPISNNTSMGEKEIYNFIKESFNGEIIENDRIENKEIDIYLPELKLGFEYNGLYWHSELNKPKNYHKIKSDFFNNIGINLIQIWEDDWEFKKDIVKSIIINKIGKSQKIYARNCEIKEITDNKLVRDFLIKNHIQGFVGSKIKLGLFLNNELVSLMTFGNLRKSLGQKSIDGSYELLRFCNKLNTSVIGGASKLFKYFINNYPVKQVISYSDNSRGVGNLYKNLGFNLNKETDINYYWCKNGMRYYRFNFRKDKLIKEGYDPNKTEVEIMHDRNYFRIFDCGSKKWIFEKNI